MQLIHRPVQQYDRRTTLNSKGFKVYSRDVSHFDGVVDKAERLLEKLRPLAKPGVCIQAGGWCGAYPVVLADYFATTMAYEPDSHNFGILKHNTSNLSDFVSISNSALADRVCNRYLQVTRSTLSHRVLQTPGSTKCVSIDSLNLPSCSTIILSTSGSEATILQGAEKTIKQHEPIIVVESKIKNDILPEVRKALPDYVLYVNSGTKYIFLHHWQAYKLGYFDR